MMKKEKSVNKTGVEINDVFTEFVKWSVMTKNERQLANLSTAQLFAEKYKLHPSQLSRWKQNNSFLSYKEQYQREKLQELTPDVLDAFFRRCTKYGTANDIELWLTLVEGWDKKKVVERKASNFDLNDVQILISNLPAEKQKLYYTTIARLLADARQFNNQ